MDQRITHSSDKRLKLYTFSLFLFFSVYSIAGTTTFAKLVGGSGTDSGRSIAFTADGGYMIAGYTTSNSNGFADMYVIRFNSVGDTVWTRKYGSTGVEQAYGIEATNDGNFVVVGYSTSWGGGGAQDGYLIKIDINGNQLWERFFGGSGTDGLESVQQTSDGGLILCGYSNSAGSNGVKDIYLVKTDASGVETWSRKIGGTADDWGNIARETADGGYIIIGGTFSYGSGNGNNDYYLVKTDGSGTVQWSKTYGGSGIDEGKNIRPESGGYIITGDTDSKGAGMDDIWIIKTDLNGDSLWSKTFGGTDKEASKMIIPTSDGGYIVSAITRSFGLANPDAWIIKLDGSGGMSWEKKYGGSAHEHDYATLPTPDGGYISVGHSDSYGNMEQVYLIKMDVNGDAPLVPTKVDNLVLSEKLKVFPNPNRGKFTLEIPDLKLNNGIINIYDITGKLVMNKPFIQNDNMKIDIESFLKGVYILNVITKEGSYFKKVIKE